MTDDSGRWRMRIPITDLKDIDMRSPYSDTLDREQFKLYSMLADFGIDYKTIDVYNDILGIDISFDDEVLQDNIVSDNNSESSEEWIKIDNIIKL